MGSKDSLYKSDKFKTLAKKKGYSSRAIFKLEEIDKKYKILKNNDIVLDLGYWPGGWIDYCSKKAKLCIGIDLKENDKYQNKNNIKLIIKDIFDENILNDILYSSNNKKINVVLSDMMSKTTGQKDLDNYSSFSLAKRAFLITKQVITKNGFFIAKIFESNYAQELIKEIKQDGFNTKTFKPKSSRQNSREYYIIAEKI